ncbi:MAG: alkaline phosphatase D family protein [Acidobacteriota bacterium]
MTTYRAPSFPPATRPLALLAVALVPFLGCTGSSAPPPTTAPDLEVAAAAPAVNAGLVLEHIGFGSCLHQSDPQPILDAVLGRDLDLFLFLGDNVYGDVTSTDDLVELREAYAAQAAAEGFSKLRRHVPLLATWDDHDFGLNDAGATFAGREGAEVLFDDFWQIPEDAPSAQRPGVYAAHVFGPPGRRVQILLLDTRYFRSDLVTGEVPANHGGRYIPSTDPAKTLLGDAQWRWLEEELRRPADVRLLASSIQVLAEGHSFEAWRTLPLEREKLYAVLKKTRANGVIAISGDRHRAGLYRRDDVIGYPLFEITSSSLNRPSSAEEEPGPHRLGDSYRPENFGAIHFDWDAGSVRLEIADIEGRTVREQSIPLDLLRVKDGRD